MKNLTSSIEVSISVSERLQEQFSENSQGESTSSIEFSSMSSMQASAILRDVQVDGSWTDPSDCSLWMRVSISASQADDVRKTLLNNRLLQIALAHARMAEDMSAAAGKRQEALQKAESLLLQIDFAWIDDGNNQVSLSSRLERIAKLLSSQTTMQSGIAGRFASAQASLHQALLAPTLGQRYERALASLEALKPIASQTGDSIEERQWSHKAALELMAFYAEVGDSCSVADAQQWLTQAQADIRMRADALASRGPCTADGRRIQSLRQVLAGQRADVACITRLSGQIASWDHACSQLQKLLSESGGTLSAVLPAARAAQLMDGACTSAECSGRSSAPLLLGLMADGQIAKRPGTGGEEYQFRGRIVERLDVKGRPVLSKSAQGLSGWNPISPEMTMDVVSVQINKRMSQEIVDAIRQ